MQDSFCFLETLILIFRYAKVHLENMIQIGPFFFNNFFQVSTSIIKQSRDILQLKPVSALLSCGLDKFSFHHCVQCGTQMLACLAVWSL